MRFTTTRFLFWATTLLLAVEARRGGGGSSDGDSGSSGGDDDDSGSGGGSSGGGSSTPCRTTRDPPTLSDLDVNRFVNYTEDPHFGGAYYFGRVTLNFTAIADKDVTCRSSVDFQMPLNLYAAAFIAPQSPWPVSSSNPYVIGFKAWNPAGGPDADFNASYNRCISPTDLVFLRTTSWFSYTYPNAALREVVDTVDLSFSANPTPAAEGNSTARPPSSPAVRFAGTYVEPPQDRWNNISLAQWGGDALGIPDDLCLGETTFDDPFPEGTTIEGTVSADEFVLTMRGTRVRAVYGVNASFVLEFKGSFAADNSTQAVTIDGDTVNFNVINGEENGQSALRAWGVTTMVFLTGVVLSFGLL